MTDHDVTLCELCFERPGYGRHVSICDTCADADDAGECPATDAAECQMIAERDYAGRADFEANATPCARHGADWPAVTRADISPDALALLAAYAAADHDGIRARVDFIRADAMRRGMIARTRLMDHQLATEAARTGLVPDDSRLPLRVRGHAAKRYAELGDCRMAISTARHGLTTYDLPAYAFELDTLRVGPIYAATAAE